MADTRVASPTLRPFASRPSSVGVGHGYTVALTAPGLPAPVAKTPLPPPPPRAAAPPGCATPVTFVNDARLSDYYALAADAEVLGAGAAAQVLRGMALADGAHGPRGAPVAIKRMPAIKRRTAANDLALLQACAGPHVPRVFAAFADGTWLYIVMELIEGHDLYEFTRRQATQGRLTERLVR